MESLCCLYKAPLCLQCMCMHSFAPCSTLNVILNLSLPNMHNHTHTQTHKRVCKNDESGLLKYKHVFLSLPDSWVIFILNAGELVSLPHCVSLSHSDFSPPFTSPPPTLLSIYFYSLVQCESIWGRRGNTLESYFSPHINVQTHATFPKCCGLSHAF